MPPERPMVRKAVGGKAPDLYKPEVIKIDPFQDHAQGRAFRVYNTQQDPTQQTLPPLWSYQIYVTQEVSEAEFESFVKDVYNTLTRVAVLTGETRFWRFEFFLVPITFTPQDCADHYRQEKKVRTFPDPPIPEYDHEMKSTASFLMIVRDPKNWKSDGLDIYNFDRDMSRVKDPESKPSSGYLRSKVLIAPHLRSEEHKDGLGEDDNERTSLGNWRRCSTCVDIKAAFTTMRTIRR